MWLEKNASSQTLRNRIKGIFNERATRQLIDESNDDEMLKLARELSGGVRFASPVFDGASEGQIMDYLREVGLPESGDSDLA